MSNNGGAGVRVLEGSAYLDNTYVVNNEGCAISMMGMCSLALNYCDIRDNKGGALHMSDHCVVSARNSTGDQWAEEALKNARSYSGLA